MYYHVAYFIHGEHNESAPTLALLCVLMLALLFSGRVVYMNVDTNQAALMTTVLYMSYFRALTSKILVC